MFFMLELWRFIVLPSQQLAGVASRDFVGNSAGDQDLVETIETNLSSDLPLAPPLVTRDGRSYLVPSEAIPTDPRVYSEPGYDTTGWGLLGGRCTKASRISRADA